VVILGGIAALGIVFAVLLEQVVLAQSAFKLARLRADVVAAEARNHQLLLDASKLQNAERIEQYARDQLGMVPARSASAEYIVADVARRSAPVTGRGEPEAAAGIAARAPAEETSP
jgi:cell division protein FtsL